MHGDMTCPSITLHHDRIIVAFEKDPYVRGTPQMIHHHTGNIRPVDTPLIFVCPLRHIQFPPCDTLIKASIRFGHVLDTVGRVG
jgi:hypothetical protein